MTVSAGFARRPISTIFGERPRRLWRVPAFVQTLSTAAVLVLAVLYAMTREGISPEGPGAPPRQMAILPFESEGGPPDDSLGAGLALLVQLNLDNLPGLSMTPPRQVKRWWDGHGGSLIGVEI